jgi:hypothetical protein
MPVLTSPDDHTKGGVRYPYVDISYDLSPIIMTINQSPASMLHFIVRMCAVIGGVLSVTRMLDMIVDRSFRAAGYTPFTPRSSAAGSDRYTPRTSIASGLPSMPSYTGGPLRSNLSGGGSFSGGGAPGSPLGRYGSGNLIRHGSGNLIRHGSGNAASFGGQGGPVSQSGLSHTTFRSAVSSHPGQSPLAPQGSWQGPPVGSQGTITSYGSGNFIFPPPPPPQDPK